MSREYVPGKRRAGATVSSVPTGQVLQVKEIADVMYAEADTDLDLAQAAARTD